MIDDIIRDLVAYNEQFGTASRERIKQLVRDSQKLDGIFRAAQKELVGSKAGQSLLRTLFSQIRNETLQQIGGEGDQRDSGDSGGGQTQPG
jgi:ribosomal 50S subunit-associated protein YjgA (DUF615 family)